MTMKSLSPFLRAHRERTARGAAPSLCVLAMAAVLSSHANAFDGRALYRCATKDVVVYQDQACVTGTQTEVKIVVPTFRASPRMAVLSSHANAFDGKALYKCATNGVLVYQDHACFTGTQTEVKLVVPTFGASPPMPVQYALPKFEPSVKEDSLETIRVPVVAYPPPKD